VLPSGTVRAKVGVVLPADHAALLALNLIEQIGLFEQNFGAIRHPAWKAFRDRATSIREEVGKTPQDPKADNKQE